MHIFWCNFDGLEKEQGTLQPGEELKLQTHPGHIFNVRTVKSGLLLYSLEVWPPQLVTALVEPCTGMAQEEVGLDTSRWPEFERLAAAAQEECVGPSGKWSCVRHVSDEEVAARDPKLYGFTGHEAEGTVYAEGATVDHIHKDQQRYIPNMTAYEGGYLKMQMTEKLKELLPFYETRKKHMKKHQHIPGFFTNHHKEPMDTISLDHFHHMHTAVIAEMKQVLEWWTKRHLKHTTTFGIRIYRRGAMLLNHLDRKDTHLASAVLQVAQVTDENGGWPLEVIHPHQPGLKEVYLQPGEMLLYEGSRLEHGRPQRFRGEEFANVFSHFVPAEYRGPEEDWTNPHFKSEL